MCVLKHVWGWKGRILETLSTVMEKITKVVMEIRLSMTIAYNVLAPSQPQGKS